MRWLLHDDPARLRELGEEVERQRRTHDSRVAVLVKQALGDTDEPKPANGSPNGAPKADKADDPTPVNVISLKIAGFSDEEIAELVQKGGGNAALE